MKFGPNLDHVMRKCSTLLIALKFSHSYWSWKELLASFDNLTSSGTLKFSLRYQKGVPASMAANDNSGFQSPMVISDINKYKIRRYTRLEHVCFCFPGAWRNVFSVKVCCPSLHQLLWFLRPHLYTLRMSERRSLARYSLEITLNGHTNIWFAAPDFLPL
ncbi:uncharacterized protein LOC127239973 isoform X1 [Andrographis paniculata]|uniref:uncharacterized protein LOC127239973 isoform X1 n=1 Tax=Andrographis paniculata TaxID=175694 RepID=UPI0021E982B3|nr:uncharacterized protein LOC127239973 isoform X1 [Andrographis paniculata]